MCRLANCILLYVGRIEPLKGIDILIQALRLLQQARNLRLPCGDRWETPNRAGGPQRGDGAAADDDANRPDLATGTSWQAQPGYPAILLFRRAKSVVVPSHYELFGMVALEAMACGTPVVASQVGGLAFLVQDGVTGYTVPVDDPKALASRLAKILCDPELRRKMGNRRWRLHRNTPGRTSPGRSLSSTGRQHAIIRRSGLNGEQRATLINPGRRPGSMARSIGPSHSGSRR